MDWSTNTSAICEVVSTSVLFATGKGDSMTDISSRADLQGTRYLSLTFMESSIPSLASLRLPTSQSLRRATSCPEFSCFNSHLKPTGFVSLVLSSDMPFHWHGLRVKGQELLGASRLFRLHYGGTPRSSASKTAKLCATSLLNSVLAYSSLQPPPVI